MTLWEYYLQYTSGVLDGSKPCPAGITIEGTDDMARAASLLTQAEKLGMDGFVKACAGAAARRTGTPAGQRLRRPAGLLRVGRRPDAISD